MSATTETLDPAVRPAIERVLARCKAEGLPIVLAETDRDYAKQAAVYKAGHSKCDGITKISLHQARLAADLVALDPKGNRSWDYARFETVYRRMAQIAREEGLETGQDWPPFDKTTGLGWDVPHLQMRAPA